MSPLIMLSPTGSLLLSLEVQVSAMAGHKRNYEIPFKLKIVQFAELESNQAAARTFATSPASLLCGSCLSAGACARAHLPCALSTAFRASLVVFCLPVLVPEHQCYPVHAAPRPPPFSPWSVLPAPVPPRPTASPASLLPGQCRLSAPATGPTGYMYIILPLP